MKGKGLKALLSVVWIRRLVWGVGAIVVLAFAVEGASTGPAICSRRGIARLNWKPS